MNFPEQSVPDAVGRFCAEYIGPGCSILIAVSGGADSIALLHALVQLQKTGAFSRIGVAHINHCLRGELSDRDETFVKATAEKLNVAFYHKSLDPTENKPEGLEDWARKRRYDFLEQVRKREHYDYVATGHTADDQAETVVFRIMRGAGIAGRAGIAPVRDDGIIRPLLFVWRSQIETWLEVRGLTHRTDESNWDISLKRNWIRHEVLPRLESTAPGIKRHLCEIAGDSREIERKLRPFVNKWLSTYVYDMTPQRFEVERQGFLFGSIAYRGLLRLSAHKGIPLTRDHLTDISHHTGVNGRQFLLPGNWEYLVGRDRTRFQHHDGSPQRQPARHLSIPGEVDVDNGTARVYAQEIASLPVISADCRNWRVVIDAAVVGSSLVVRPAEKEDVFRPLGGTILHPLERYLKKQGLAAFERKDRWVVAESGGSVIWVVGVQIAHDYRITSRTKRVLEMGYRKI